METKGKGRKKKESEKGEELKQKRLSTPFKKKGWKNPNCTYRGAQRSWPSLKQILQQENYSRVPPHYPTYTSIEASGPILYPPKKYCDLTGYLAKYTDPKTKLRYASAEVYQFIRTSLTEEDVDKFLALRNVVTRIK